jgi:hypothetical protein
MKFTFRSFLAGCLLTILPASHEAQGYIFGFMGGPTLSNQRVSGFQREPFLRYHGLIYIESTSEINPNALYARLGYHIKGSAVNIHRVYDFSGNELPGRSYSMEFHNASLSLGFKQRREFGKLFYHYAFGIRGDYNVKTEFGALFKGLEGSENKFTYGVNVDVGMEFPLSELASVVVELGFSPDLAQQIFIPPQPTGYTYQHNGEEIILPETNLTNIVFEARVGFRFWRKIIYVD